VIYNPTAYHIEVPFLTSLSAKPYKAKAGIVLQGSILGIQKFKQGPQPIIMDNSSLVVCVL
jgi:hypothetical protein